MPIGGFTILAILLLLHIQSPKHEKLTAFAQIKHLDPVGIFFFLPSITCLILALQWGGSTSSWLAPKIIGLFVNFGVFLVIFIVIEVTMPGTAMIPTRVVLNRSVAGSMGFMFLMSGALMSILYYLTIWFQLPSPQGRPSPTLWCQHDPITRVHGDLEHSRRHIYREDRVLCSCSIDCPSRLRHWRRLSFISHAELTPKGMDGIPGSSMGSASAAALRLPLSPLIIFCHALTYLLEWPWCSSCIRLVAPSSYLLVKKSSRPSSKTDSLGLRASLQKLLSTQVQLICEVLCRRAVLALL